MSHRALTHRYSAAGVRFSHCGRRARGWLGPPCSAGRRHEKLCNRFQCTPARDQGRSGTKHYFGKAARPDLLHAAGIQIARMLVVAIDDYDGINKIVLRVIRAHSHVNHPWGLSCRDIIRETYESTLRISRSALEAQGSTRKKDQAMIDAFHEGDQDAMIEMAPLYDPNLPVRENEEYITRTGERRGDWEADQRARMTESLEEKGE